MLKKTPGLAVRHWSIPTYNVRAGGRERSVRISLPGFALMMPIKWRCSARLAFIRAYSAMNVSRIEFRWSRSWLANFTGQMSARR